MASSILTFVKQAGTGAQVVPGTTPGLVSHGMLIWSSRKTTTGVSDGVYLSQGVTDGTRQACRSIGSPSNESSVSLSQSERSDRLVLLTNTTTGATPTVEVEGSFVSFNSDGGFTINWLVNDGAATIFHCLMLQCKTYLKILELQSSGSVNITDIPFQPQGFIVTTGAAGETGTETEYTLGNPYCTFHALGVSDGTSQLSCVTQYIGNGSVFSTRRTDRCLEGLVANLGIGGSVLYRATITGITSSGFTLNRTGGDTSKTPLAYILCLGANVRVGLVTCPNSPGTVSIALPFRPDAVLVYSPGVFSGFMEYCIGSIDQVSGAIGGVWIGGVGGANPSVFLGEDYSNKALRARRPDTSAITMEATGAITSTGFNMTFSVTPGSVITFPYLAVYTTLVAPTNPPTVFVNSTTSCCTDDQKAAKAAAISTAMGPFWIPSCTGGGVTPSANDLILPEHWDY